MLIYISLDPGFIFDGDSDLDPATGLPVPKPRAPTPAKEPAPEDGVKEEPMEGDREAEKENSPFQVVWAVRQKDERNQLPFFINIDD